MEKSPVAVSQPVFYEGRDVCSRDCLRALVAADVQNAFQSPATAPESYSHRMPLGLLMLSRKWITHAQLTSALSLQRSSGEGRIGEWLVSTGAVDEETVARAVAMQWGVPMLLARKQSLEASGLVPLLLTDAFGAIPIRVAANRILYLAVEQQVHSSLNRAIERITGLRVEPVILTSSTYLAVHQSVHETASTRGRFYRSQSSASLYAAILALLDEQLTRNVQIATVGKYIWVRLLRSGRNQSSEETEDIVFIVEADCSAH